jgi:hypothetical protein
MQRENYRRQPATSNQQHLCVPALYSSASRTVGRVRAADRGRCRCSCGSIDHGSASLLLGAATVGGDWPCGAFGSTSIGSRSWRCRWMSVRSSLCKITANFRDARSADRAAALAGDRRASLDGARGDRAAGRDPLARLRRRAAICARHGDASSRCYVARDDASGSSSASWPPAILTIVHVLPNLHAVGRMHKKLNVFALRSLGARTAPRIGKGRDFDRLRDWVRDDD